MNFSKYTYKKLHNIFIEKNEMANQNSREICAIIPIYKEQLSKDEYIVIENNINRLGNVDIFFVAPMNLAMDAYKSFEIDVIYFPTRYFKGIDGYNRLMLNPRFYKTFLRYQYMLIVQTDAVLLRDGNVIEKFIKEGFDYYGAPWGHQVKLCQYDFSLYFEWIKKIVLKILSNKLDYRICCVGNGGLSLRKIDKTILLLKKYWVYRLLWSGNEDTFIAYFGGENCIGYKVSTIDIAREFSLEGTIAPDLLKYGTPFGIHAYNAYFVNVLDYIDDLYNNRELSIIEIGQKISLMKYSTMGALYICEGISFPQENGSWSMGRRSIFNFVIKNTTLPRKVKCQFYVAEVSGGAQKVEIFANRNFVKEILITKERNIEFEYLLDTYDLEIKFIYPNIMNKCAEKATISISSFCIDGVNSMQNRNAGITEDSQKQDEERNMMIEKGKISIILPTYNRGYIVDKAIESILAQTYDNWELIIVDDASIDNTKAIVDSFDDRRIQYYRNDVNHGLAYTRNYGIEKSIGEFVAFIDSDVTWKENKIELQLEDMARKVDIAFGQIHQYTPGSDYLVPVYRYDAASLKDDLIETNKFDINSVMIRHEVLNRVGGFDPLMRGVEDWELFFRMIVRENCSFHYREQVLVDNIWQEDSLSLNQGNYLLNRLYFLCKHCTYYSDREIASFALGVNSLMGIGEDVSELYKISISILPPERCANIFVYVINGCNSNNNNIIRKSYENYRNNGIVKQVLAGRSIAVYGAGKRGEAILNDFMGQGIEIAYFIDKSVKSIHNYSVLQYDDDWPIVDFIVVSLLKNPDLVKRDLVKKTNIAVYTWDEFLKAIVTGEL